MEGDESLAVGGEGMSYSSRASSDHLASLPSVSLGIFSLRVGVICDGSGPNSGGGSGGNTDNCDPTISRLVPLPPSRNATLVYFRGAPPRCLWAPARVRVLGPSGVGEGGEA